MRSFFGLNGSSSTRKVVGKTESFDVKDVGHLQESNVKLTALHHLYSRYQGTPHAQKIKIVYEKTKNIHNYLVSRNRLYELALFHIQNTEHFINTFTAIINVHQHQPVYAGLGQEAMFSENAPSPPAAFKPDKLKQKPRPHREVEMIRPLQGGVFHELASAPKSEVPVLAVPEIYINTFAKIPYAKEEVAQGVVAEEIGYTSTAREKEAFLQYIAARLGISNITYAGNAHMTMPNSNGSTPTGLVPVIYWENSLYAVNLNDYRIFPVKIFRKVL